MENIQQPEKGCQTCKQKGPGSFQIGAIILGGYLLFSSIYGTIAIIKEITHYFNY
jgi:hypothetical protein